MVQLRPRRFGLGARLSVAKKINIDQFDFNSGTAFTDVAWHGRNWTFTVGGDYRRLLSSDNYVEFYHEFVPRWAVRRDFQLCDAFTLTVGYEGDYRFTESAPPFFANNVPPNNPPVFPDTFNDRTDQSLVLVGLIADVQPRHPAAVLPPAVFALHADEAATTC